MATDNLAMQGARTSAAIVLPKNILASLPEWLMNSLHEYIYKQTQLLMCFGDGVCYELCILKIKQLTWSFLSFYKTFLVTVSIGCYFCGICYFENMVNHNQS